MTQRMRRRGVERRREGAHVGALSRCGTYHCTTTALTPCWRGLAATEEPLKVVSGARVREGRNASDQHANCKVFENRPRGHLTRITGAYPHKHRAFYVSALLGGRLGR